ncbi:hypothetical protein [Pseudomonas chlororaphis]|uniref:hypothetical protein n=1 Tax=Pseudomonas chlororaphis TaxID=587753 RepID=UPI0013DE13AB|nr:hypothetical protein [Pseudomonas chlororaphis]
MISTVEKYALEIEIFTLSRGFRGQISRSRAQKRRFQRSVGGQSGGTDFFNRIGRLLPFATAATDQKQSSSVLQEKDASQVLKKWAELSL